jgi:hypothetical protein
MLAVARQQQRILPPQVDEDLDRMSVEQPFQFRQALGRLQVYELLAAQDNGLGACGVRFMQNGTDDLSGGTDESLSR